MRPTLSEHSLSTFLFFEPEPEGSPGALPAHTLPMFRGQAAWSPGRRTLEGKWSSRGRLDGT